MAKGVWKVSHEMNVKITERQREREKKYYETREKNNPNRGIKVKLQGQYRASGEES